MIAVCKQCNAKQDADISGVKGKVVRYSCEACGTQNLFVLPSKVLDEQRMKGKLKAQGLSIRTKITMIIVLLVALSVSAVGFIASDRGAKALADQAGTNIRQITALKAREYNAIFSRISDEIEGASAYAEQTFNRSSFETDLGYKALMPWNGSGYGSPETEASLSYDILALQRVGMFLKGLVAKNPFIDLGYMASRNDVMTLSDEDVVKVLASREDYVPSKRAWFTAAADAGKTIWTDPYVDAVTKQLVVTCATPVYNERKEMVGVVGFDVLLATIQKDIMSLDIGYNSVAFLVGKKGNLLARPGMSTTGADWNQTIKTDNLLEHSDAEFKTIVGRMISGETGVATHVENGKKSIISFAPLQVIGASVGISMSENDVMKPAYDIRKLIISVWGVVLIITLIVGYSIGNGITRPIREIITRADLISQGKTDLDLMKTDRRDEIGVLVESFNRLISSLKIAMSIDR